MTAPVHTDQPDPLARTARTRLLGIVIAMVVAPWLVVVAETANAVMARDGDDLTPHGELATVSQHLTLDRWASFAALIGALLLVPAVLGVMRLVRTEAARLGLVGGVLMAAAYVCYFAMVFQGFTADAMVSVGGSSSQHEQVLQAVLDEPLTLWVYLLFVLGNLVGTFLLGLALVRARTAGRIAGYGLMAWPVLHVAGFPFAESVGAVGQAMGFALAARALLGRSTATDATTQAYELLRR